MNKTILKILIGTLILLIGIGAVSAIEDNSTDEFMSFEQNDEISVIEDNNEIISIGENDSEPLSSQDSDGIFSVCENESESLSSQDSDGIISVSEDNGELLNLKDIDAVISVSGDNTLLNDSPFAQDPQMTQSQTEYKTFYLGKLVIPKKYKKFYIKDYKPSKKNKKAWKNYKKFKKLLNKRGKKLSKHVAKIANSIKMNHWNPLGEDSLSYKIKYRGSNIYTYFYIYTYRTYNYNPLLNKGWWD